MAPPDAGTAPEDQTKLFWRFPLPYLIEQCDHGDTTAGRRLVTFGPGREQDQRGTDGRASLLECGAAILSVSNVSLAPM